MAKKKTQSRIVKSPIAENDDRNIDHPLAQQDIYPEHLTSTELEAIVLDKNRLLSGQDSASSDLLSGKEDSEATKDLLFKSFNSLVKKARYENIIRIVSQTVHSSIDLNEVTENAVMVMNENIDTAQNVSIYMVEGKEAVLQAYRGYPCEFLKQLQRIPYPKGFTWKAISDGKPIYCPDVDKDDLIGPAGRRLGTKSYVSMPICHAGKTIGCININSDTKYALDKEELNLLEIVALQIESAINNAKRADELKESQEELKEYIAKLTRKNRDEKITNAITRSIHQSLDLNQVFKNAVDAMAKNIKGAKYAVIFMVENTGCEDNENPSAVLKASHGHPDEYIESVKSIPYPKGATWKTIIEGKPRYVPNTSKDASIGKACTKFGTKSYLTVPLKLEDDTVGCLHIQSSKINAFSQAELEILIKVATQLETAINKSKQAKALKISEEALRKTHDELEDRVRERTSELQKSNTLLIKEILERRCVENELKASLNEKDVLLKEIHHRVKNNLQIISSLLKIQSRHINNAEAINTFNESNNRIRSIATLHEQLYHSKDLTRIDFAAYINNMKNYLLRSYGISDNSIRINVELEKIFLDINTAIPCGLIINELISNALKHGFPGGRKGEVKIDFRRENGSYMLKVSNDGVRLPEDIDINNSSTLGLELVSSLSKQLKGNISVNSGALTEFKLEFDS